MVFSSTLWKPTVLMITINFGINFGLEWHIYDIYQIVNYPSIAFHQRYYGLWMWFPELFSRLDNYYSNFPEASISVCEVIDYRPANQTDHCLNYSAPDSNSFINIFIIALAPLPANIWTILHMDKLGRKFFLGNEFCLIFYNRIFIYFLFVL